MKTLRPAVRHLALRAVSACARALLLSVGLDARAGEGRPAEDQLATGRELFTREWVPGDPRSFAGDGLGPAYNEHSCVACHNLGGTGGAGPNDRNVVILTAGGLRGGLRGEARQFQLGASHPEFFNARSIVLHRFGTDAGYESWRRVLMAADDRAGEAAEAQAQRLRGRAGAFVARRTRQRLLGRRTSVLLGGETLSASRRNPSALLGVGLIEAIPETAIREAADRVSPDWPQVHGRVSRPGEGRVGRFGWKAQVPSLRDFVLTACASELGLEVPGHRQASLPTSPAAPAKGLDLSQEQCAALVAFVAGLRGPDPGRPGPDGPHADPDAAEGRALFESTGCAACHAPKLGPAEGIYSDLLLHDMGPDLADGGIYYGQDDAGTPGGAKDREWRTPPLWGVRDSAPYLHDGRAPTLDEAVALHGGEGDPSASRYSELPEWKRSLIRAFLRSLAVPPAVVQ